MSSSPSDVRFIVLRPQRLRALVSQNAIPQGHRSDFARRWSRPSLHAGRHGKPHEGSDLMRPIAIRNRPRPQRSSSTAAIKPSRVIAISSLAASDAEDTPRKVAPSLSWLKISGGSGSVSSAVESDRSIVRLEHRRTMGETPCRRRLILDCEHLTRRVPKVQPISFAMSTALTPCFTICATRSRAVEVKIVRMTTTIAEDW